MSVDRPNFSSPDVPMSDDNEEEGEEQNYESLRINENHEVPQGWKKEIDIFKDFCDKGLLTEDKKSAFHNLIIENRDNNDYCKKYGNTFYYSQEFIDFLERKLPELSREIPEGWPKINEIIDDFVEKGLIVEEYRNRLRNAILEFKKSAKIGDSASDKNDIVLYGVAYYYNPRVINLFKDMVKDWLPDPPEDWLDVGRLIKQWRGLTIINDTEEDRVALSITLNIKPDFKNPPTFEEQIAKGLLWTKRRDIEPGKKTELVPYFSQKYINQVLLTKFEFKRGVIEQRKARKGSRDD